MPCPLSGDLPKPRIKPRSPVLQSDSLPSEPPGKPLIDPEFLINSVFHFFLYHTQLEFAIPLASGLHYYYEQSPFTCIIVVQQKQCSFPLSFYKIFSFDLVFTSLTVIYLVWTALGLSYMDLWIYDVLSLL